MNPLGRIGQPLGRIFWLFGPNFGELDLRRPASEYGLPYTQTSYFSITDLTSLSSTSGLARIKMALRDPPGPNLNNFKPCVSIRPDSELGFS